MSTSTIKLPEKLADNLLLAHVISSPNCLGGTGLELQSAVLVITRSEAPNGNGAS
jgi:hypothetical protein